MSLVLRQMVVLVINASKGMKRNQNEKKANAA